MPRANLPAEACRPPLNGSGFAEDRPPMESCPALRAQLAIVAEDDEAGRHLIAAWLEHMGYRVLSACDGVELVERIEALHCGGELDEAFLIVTDVDMPKRDGLAALALVCPRF